MARKLVVADWSGTCFEHPTDEEQNRKIAYAVLDTCVLFRIGKKYIPKPWKIPKMLKLLKTKKELQRRLDEYKAGKRPLAEVYEPFNRYVVRGLPLKFLWGVLNEFAEESKNLVDGRVLRPIREAGRNGQAAGVLSVSVRYSIEAVLEKSGYKDVFDSNLIVSNQILPAKRDMKSWERDGVDPDSIEPEFYRTLLEISGEDYGFRTECITLDIYGRKGEVMEDEFFRKRGYSPGDTFYLGDSEDDLPIADMLKTGHFVVPFLATEEFREKVSRKYGAFVPEDEQDLQKYLLSD